MDRDGEAHQGCDTASAANTAVAAEWASEIAAVAAIAEEVVVRGVVEAVVAAAGSASWAGATLALVSAAP
jgi:hypothetical protein